MNPTNIEHQFNYRIEKSSSEISLALKKKAAELSSKIGIREGRIAKLRDEYKIDDAAMAQLFAHARREAMNRNASSMFYTYSAATVKASGEQVIEERSVGAGVVMNLLTENDYIETEKANVRRLELIGRHLKPLTKSVVSGGAVVEVVEDTFAVSYAELEFLGL